MNHVIICMIQWFILMNLHHKCKPDVCYTCKIIPIHKIISTLSLESAVHRPLVRYRIQSIFDVFCLIFLKEITRYHTLTMKLTLATSILLSSLSSTHPFTPSSIARRNVFVSPKNFQYSKKQSILFMSDTETATATKEESEPFA